MLGSDTGGLVTQLMASDPGMSPGWRWAGSTAGSAHESFDGDNYKNRRTSGAVTHLLKASEQPSASRQVGKNADITMLAFMRMSRKCPGQ